MANAQAVRRHSFAAAVEPGESRAGCVQSFQERAQVAPPTTVNGGAGTAVSRAWGARDWSGRCRCPHNGTATVPAEAALLTGTNLGSAPAADSSVPGSVLGGLPLADSAERGVAGIVPDARFLERPPMVPRWSNLG